MRVLRTIVADDEPLAAQYLVTKLSNHPQIEIVAVCKNGHEVINAVYEFDPDLLFLDIQMPGCTGLEVVKKLQSDTMPLVIFATAYEKYALNAFDANAVDYILKPIQTSRLTVAIDRALTRYVNMKGFRENQKGDVVSAITFMEKQRNNVINFTEKSVVNGDFFPTPNYDEIDNKRVVIKDRDEIHLLNQSDIEWIDAAGDYVCVHANGDTHVKRSTLKEMEEELSSEIFKRVHRSTIVNLNYVDKVIPLTKGEYFLLLGKYQKVKVSRKYKEVIRAFLEQ